MGFCCLECRHFFLHVSNFASPFDDFYLTQAFLGFRIKYLITDCQNQEALPDTDTVLAAFVDNDPMVIYDLSDSTLKNNIIGFSLLIRHLHYPLETGTVSLARHSCLPSETGLTNNLSDFR